MEPDLTDEVTESKRRPRLTKAVARGLRAMIDATESIDSHDMEDAANWLRARLGDRGLE